MKKVKVLFLVITLIFSYSLTAQVAINTDGSSAEPSAMLDVKSTDKGLLPPRMTEAQRDGISSPAAGLLIFQTDGMPGYYYHTGTDWIGLLSTGSGGNSTSALIDVDGNIYATITIGDQVWMAENLKVTHYRNGEAIANITDNTAWSALTSGAFCWYDNDKTTNEKYGALYNWYVVDDSRGLCPTGWHSPEDNGDWASLAWYLGGNSVAGGKMKATSDLWISPNIAATNSSSFSGLPGGRREHDGGFGLVGDTGYWWMSDEYSVNKARYRELVGHSGAMSGNLNDLKQCGFSVRCILD